MQEQRRRQIVDAFIDLVAERGLEGVALDDVAAAAGMQRAAIRHFVGNRQQLVAAGIQEIARRAVDDDLGATTSFTELATLLFNARRINNLTAADDAWKALAPEAMRTPDGRTAIKLGWDRLIAAVGAALRHEYPRAAEAAVRDTAYAIACLAEHDFIFQRAGYPRARSAGAKDAALALASRLG